MLVKKKYGSWDDDNINNYWLNSDIIDCSNITVEKLNNVNLQHKSNNYNVKSKYNNKRNDRLPKSNQYDRNKHNMYK